MRALPLAMTAGLSVVALVGCSSLGPNEAAAGDVASAFSAALGDGNGAEACDLLNDATRTELEQSSEQACDQAILEEDLPTAEQVMDIKAYGRSARVILEGDVVFLSVADGGWRVTAAGCQPQANQPYDCSLTGG